MTAPRRLDARKVADGRHATAEFRARRRRLLRLLGVGQRLACRHRVDPCLARLGRNCNHVARAAQAMLRLLEVGETQALRQQHEIEQGDGEKSVDFLEIARGQVAEGEYRVGQPADCVAAAEAAALSASMR